MTAIQAIESGLDVASGRITQETQRDGVQFTEQQSQFIKEALEWLAFPQSGNRLMALHGFAGTGKSFVVNHLLAIAQQSGILQGEVWATAPTHIAKNVLRRSCENSAAEISNFLTSHSFFGLRPQLVVFDENHEKELDRLLAISEEFRSPDESLRINALIWRRNAALEQLKEFLPTEIQDDAENVRLLVVDEFSMINEVLAALYFEFPYYVKDVTPKTRSTKKYEIAKKNIERIEEESKKLIHMHPNLQILFLGDPAQLPPIGEKESLICKVPRFTPLTEVVRNQGDVLAYCTAVRESLESRLSTLHYEFDGADVSIMSQAEVFSQLPEVIDSGESIRFVAGTNERCREINELARYRLKGIEKGLTYYPGDIVLSLSAIERSLDGLSRRGKRYEPNYGVSCGGEFAKTIDGTSTLFELGEELKPGDAVLVDPKKDIGRSVLGVDRLRSNWLEFTSHAGTTFHRRFFRYREYDSKKPFYEKKALALINPEEYGQWLSECDQLWKRARTTKTTSKKNSRGQCGDGAKSVWQEFGLKSWDKKIDGSNLTQDEYTKIKVKVWSDAFRLSQFSDKVSFSYCSTAHRSQGITVDIAILDERTLMKSQIGKYSQDFDLRKLIYTAATRARTQLIVMV